MTELLAQATVGGTPWLAVAVLFLVLGLVFLIAEFLVFSFGALSLACLACFGTCLYVAFENSVPAGITFLVLILVLGPTEIVVLVKTLPNTWFGRKLISRNPKAEEVTAAGVDAGQTRLVGHRGRTITQCRPAGVAEIDGDRVDVVTEGMVVYPGEDVEVVRVEGNRVVIRKVKEAPKA